MNRIIFFSKKSKNGKIFSTKNFGLATDIEMSGKMKSLRFLISRHTFSR